MSTRLIAALAGYVLGYVIANSCGVAEKDQLLIMFTTLLSIAIAKEIEKEWIKPKKGE